MSSLCNLSHTVPDFAIEKSFNAEGYKYIAGVDEAGRGALAGPLSLAMVIYDSSFFTSVPSDLAGTITDSKQLTHKKRVKALSLIMQYALDHTRIFIPHTVIDSYGINRATEIAVSKMLGKIKIKPDIVIMDGNFRFKPDVPFYPVVKGDCKSLSIASASIIAKVTRDEEMSRLGTRFPGYGFARHKGYGTKVHMESLNSLGLCAIHRRSYEPAKSMLEKQGELFK